MTISSEVRKAGPFNCNGVTAEFSFSFKCFSSADVLVVLTDSFDVETELTIITDYTVALNPDQNASPGGSITTVATYTTGNKITLVGDVDYLQGVDLTNGGSFSADNIENALDKVTMQVQQLNEAVARSVKVDVSSADNPDDFLQNINTAVANASASASASANSANSAATSAASAAASLDSFDDRYLGVKSSDPTLDNDGNALLVGALYFNSTTGQMRVYNGTVWSVAFSADKLNKSGDNLLGLLQLDKSANIVAAATTDLGTATGNAVTVTHASGTLAITSFGGASLQAGTEITITWSVSAGSLSVTHNATSLIIPSAANLTIANGDVWKLQKTDDAQAYWRVIDITKADGKSVVQTVSQFASNAEYETGTDTTKALNSAVARARNIVLYPEVATTSGASQTISGIPSWAKRVVVKVSGVSGSGTGVPNIRLGDAGGIETTGYEGTVSIAQGATSASAGLTASFQLYTTSSAAAIYEGMLILEKMDGNEWAASGGFGRSDGTAGASFVYGTKELSDVLTQISINAGGADALDLGSFSISVE